MDHACESCRSAGPLEDDFSMAFQPIYDASAGRVWGYEALVRGTNGEPARDVIGAVTPAQLYRFDQVCRSKAISLAASLYPPDTALKLSINFLPNAVYEPAACLGMTLATARATGFPHENIMFEFTENEPIHDTLHLSAIVREYKRRNFTTAIDDFGAGYAGLGLLAEFQPDIVKVDMALMRGIDASRSRQVIVSGIARIAQELGIRVLAEGIETEAEFLAARSLGIALFQGYWFARPHFERLPPIRDGL